MAVGSIVTSRLQIVVNRCLTKILRIYWPNNISNTVLLRRANIETVVTPEVGVDWSHSSQRRKIYHKKSYGVEPFNQCRKASWQAAINVEKNCCS